MDGTGETVDFSCKDILNRPIETTMYNLMFQVPGVYIYTHIYTHMYVDLKHLSADAIDVGSFHVEDMNVAFIKADADERVMAKQKEIFALFLGLHFGM